MSESQCHQSRSRILLLLVGYLLCLIPAACNWEPRVLHSDVYQTGRTMKKGHGELGVHVIPGAALDVGIAQKTELHLGVNAAGDAVTGYETRITRGLRQSNPTFNSISVGLDYLTGNDQGFRAVRFHLGHTVSLIGNDNVLGLHLPIQLYYLKYNWDSDNRFDEFNFVSPSASIETSGDGLYVVPGLGISVTGKHLALRIGGNIPIREHVNEVELLPAVGIKLSARW